MKKEYQFWFLRDQESPKQDKLKEKKKGKKRNLRDAFCPIMTKLPLQTTGI
jgi:hypothetical protein